MKKSLIILVIISFIFSLSLPVFAAEIDKLQKAGTEIEKEKRLREKIETERPSPEIKKGYAPPEVTPPEAGERVLINKITVTGVTLLTQKEIDKIISGYQNRQLNLTDMQKVADQITDAYRQKGYITSRAYLPPQKITSGNLELRIVEGSTGDIEIKGNRYFKTSLYRKKIALKKTDPFNYEILRKGMSNINQLPDRSAKATLTPGKEPGTTDVLLEVKDRLPIHIGFDWDNFGSRYLGTNRYRTTITDNNLLGRDDILTLQYQLSEGSFYRLFMLRYLYPINDNLQIGFFSAQSKTELGKELATVEARGKAKYYSLYATQTLINTEKTNLNLSLGFDYKDIFNFQFGSEQSRDRMRVLKLGSEWDMSDKYGRTLVSEEINFGIPDIMGGLEEKDAHASRTGAGGKFTKNVLYILRLQKMPWDSMLLWKNQFQFTNNILTGAEQYQIGGIINVRGYPPAEVVGDKGYAMTWEWSLPPYFVSKKIKVPFSKANLYDALRFVAFYDWGNTALKRPQAGEQKNRTLRSIGCGWRLNLPEDLSARVEFAWPLDNSPSNGENVQILGSVVKNF